MAVEAAHAATGLPSRWVTAGILPQSFPVDANRADDVRFAGIIAAVEVF